MLRVILTALTVTRAGDGLPVKPPADVGMSGNRLGAIERVVERGIKAGGYPGASVVVGRKGVAVYEKGFGKLSWSDNSTPVDAQRTTPVIEPVETRVCWLAWIADPDGNRICLHSRKDGTAG